MDWFTPDGLDRGRRVLILGTGYIEIRKYIDIARDPGDQLYLVDRKEETLPAAAQGFSSAVYPGLPDGTEGHDRNISSRQPLCIEAQEKAVISRTE